MPRVLMVEDSFFFKSLVKKRFAKEPEYSLTCASTYAEAREIVEAGSRDYLVALLDLNLPDSPNGEIVDYFLYKNIPSVVFTGNFDEKVRERIASKNIVDYVLKENGDSLDSLVNTVNRMNWNREIEVLVVDDAELAREYVADLLRIHNFKVHLAGNGEQALEVLEMYPRIKVVIADYFMPGMDGFELVRKIRRTRSREELAIIGMSGQGDPMLSARFIKSGANDFLAKPFIKEEFYCRVTQNLEMVEQIELIRDMSNKDPLTGMYNRRYFFSIAQAMFSAAKIRKAPLSAIMVDIDHFKNVNDIYGHSAGDEVIKMVGKALENRFTDFGVVCRFGGEEFCALINGMDEKTAALYLDDFRLEIENTLVKTTEGNVKVTVSAGVSSQDSETLQEMVTQADNALYKAKETGRNRICMA